ncbi:hypothetical protein L1077_22210 [Pseudoalteromonas luteoviolacea]|uniref:reverse transcriptase domain-containing protein n=1 Tax=Pseudoalteromonas luteoviolacea TaxID=43657 RepID=UPI001EFF0BB8|nr:reverse transcriptase domain-containing protein [Pseudoalteromonas luteoviolacea]MCF6442143.1 hypothetical protein [Pseudoalteromonas luteoviolacea]
MTGNYHFSPCKAYRVKGESIGVWCAQDALVLKAMALVLSEYLSPKLSQDCYHIKGKGGSKAYVMTVKAETSQYRFVCRSDVNSYYASINHQILLKQLNMFIPDSKVMRLIERMLTRLDDVNGQLYSIDIGINKGNPLSPLLGAVYLMPMDTRLSAFCRKQNMRYYRYMDDWVILCKTRHQLRHAVKIMNTCLEAVKQTKHPFKT